MDKKYVQRKPYFSRSWIDFLFFLKIFHRTHVYYIGSGAIEGGNKTVLQRRLKQTGMRWGTEGAQYVLTLRVKKESNLWEEEVKQLICA